MLKAVCGAIVKALCFLVCSSRVLRICSKGTYQYAYVDRVFADLVSISISGCISTELSYSIGGVAFIFPSLPGRTLLQCPFEGLVPLPCALIQQGYPLVCGGGGGRQGEVSTEFIKIAKFKIPVISYPF